MRGRTYSHAGYAASADISIPAPARGRTCGKASISLHTISIPAPARGRTHNIASNFKFRRYFNSRPREGANHAQRVRPRSDFIFQFPPPRGGEHEHRVPRCRAAAISIPAPARGRTVEGTAGPGRRDHFNSRPREGANKLYRTDCKKGRISIPAPARGRTTPKIAAGMPRNDFNSRPREGANQILLSHGRH